MNDTLAQYVEQLRNRTRLELDLSNGIEILESIDFSESVHPRFITVNHSMPEHWTTLIHMAKNSDDAYRLLVKLAQKGFLVYRASPQGTELVHRSAVKRVWPELRNGVYEQDETGIVYKYSGPRAGGATKSLVVVFSSVHRNAYTQRLERNFAQIFPMLESSVPGHTGVLRIADLDGVVGGFYLPTSRDPENNVRIQEFISRMASTLGIPNDKIVAFGPSKGGTGALYTALNMGISCVAIDPIVTNERRGDRILDRYFVSSEIFQHSHDYHFARAVSKFGASTPANSRAQMAIITSRGSEEFNDISRLFNNSNLKSINIINCVNPAIKKHFHVAPKTVAFSLGVLNMYLAGLSVNIPDYFEID